MLHINQINLEDSEILEGPTTEPSGSMLIAMERARQRRVKQYDMSHDAQYTDEFLKGYAVYYCTGEFGESNRFIEELIGNRESTTSTPSMRDLIRAGALIAAEIDRRICAMSDEERIEFKNTIKW